MNILQIISTGIVVVALVMIIVFVVAWLYDEARNWKRRHGGGE